MSGMKNYMQQRQIDVKRRNLVDVCRFAIKTLIDKASLGNVDDNNEVLINFCAVIEEVLSFRLRAARTWYGSGEPRAFWDYIQQSCCKVPNNCIQSIASLENIKSPVAKGRAWIRCALMEKRLSEYITVALQQTNITRQSYLDGAVMLSEDMSTLCGELLGLNAIDFSFCLKGETLDFPSPVMIDYTPYLKFNQSPESIEEDHVELSVLNGNNQSNDGFEIDLRDNNQWEEKYKALESKFKLANEQKGYLEELVRRREYQIQETNKQRVTALNTLKQWQVDNKQERLQLEAVILELQNQVEEMKKQKEYFEHKYQGMMDRIQGSQMAMEDISGMTQPTDSDTDKLSFSSGEGISAMSSRKSYMPLGPTRKHLYTKEDTPSMKVLAGSFTSQGSDQSSSLINHAKVHGSPPTNQNLASGGSLANQKLESAEVFGSSVEDSENVLSGRSSSSINDEQRDEGSNMSKDTESINEQTSQWDTCKEVSVEEHVVIQNNDMTKTTEKDKKENINKNGDEELTLVSHHDIDDKVNVEQPASEKGEEEKSVGKSTTVSESESESIRGSTNEEVTEDVKLGSGSSIKIESEGKEIINQGTDQKASDIGEEKVSTTSSEDNDFVMLPTHGDDDNHGVLSMNESTDSIGSESPRPSEGHLPTTDNSSNEDQ